MRRVCFLGFLVLFFLLGGYVHPWAMKCEVPPFISTVVEPNILIIFDTSGSMSNIIWVDGYERSVDHSQHRLPVDDGQVVFAREEGTCFPDHNRVTYDSSREKVRLRYKKAREGATDICSAEGYYTQWSDTEGYFYFDREEGGFVEKEDDDDDDDREDEDSLDKRYYRYDSRNPQHVAIFLPYAAYSVDPESSTGEYSTWYDYDYLNWIFYDSTQEERDVLKQQHDDPEQRELMTRILVAKKVVKDLVEATENLRFGLMSFDGSEGGRLEAGVTSDIKPVLEAVDRVWAGGYTPLAETLEDVWDYFSDASKDPIQYWCQKNFVILMTDGYPTRDSDDLGALKGDWDNDRGGGSEDNVYAGTGSDYLDDIAYYIHENDSRPDLEEKQNIHTFTIGFTVVNPLLRDAAFNGNGLAGLQDEWDDPESPHYRRYFYTATNYAELKEALEAAINEVIKRISSGTAASILSTSQRTENRLFRAKFHPQTWGGFLEAFSLPYDPENPNPLWDDRADGPSSLAYRAPETRKIFTALDDEPGKAEKIKRKLSFTDLNSDTTDADDRPLYKLLRFLSKKEAKDFIKFLRNQRFKKFRERKHKLGDIIYSAPAITRDAVYVGSNDGMIHAFDINTGMEKWAFIPNNLLKKLKNLARKDYCHEYFVDLSPVLARIRKETESRTILICGERGGGDAYFALDVTGDEPIPLWEFRDKELGESWSIPFIGRLKVGEGERKLAAFFGSGFKGNPPRENIYAVDVEAGDVIGKVELNGPPGDPVNSPRAVDYDDDGFVDVLYVGDLGGKVFKVTLDSDPANWSKKELFTGESGQPISIPMSLAFYDTDPRHLFVYFGTGKYYTVEDRVDNTPQTFYAVKDDGDPVTRGTLTNQTTGCNSAEESQGWYIDFIANPGERVTASPLVAGGIVFFTTFEPDIEDPCKCGGIARLYAVQYDTGCPPTSPVLDINGDGSVDEGDMIGEEAPRSINIGYGLPSDVIFDPADSQLIIQTSDTTVHAITVKLLGERITIHAWRQVFH